MEKNKHHIAVYNNKEVVMDYVKNPKEEFKYACMRIYDNLGTGPTPTDKGYVICPDGKKYEISRDSKKAKLVKENKMKTVTNFLTERANRFFNESIDDIDIDEPKEEEKEIERKAYKVTIEFETGNDAFEDEAQECSKILKDIAEDLNDRVHLTVIEKSIKDSNGNTVGKFEVKEI